MAGTGEEGLGCFPLSLSAHRKDDPESAWQVLSALHACHLLAVSVGVVAPGALYGAAGRKEALSLILLNSMSLSVACRRAHACQASTSQFPE